MAGTVEGGKKAAQTMKERYGEQVYEWVGRLGGQVSRGRHFADQTIGEDGLTNAARAGRLGGATSRRTKANNE